MLGEKGDWHLPEGGPGWPLWTFHILPMDCVNRCAKRTPAITALGLRRNPFILLALPGKCSFLLADLRSATNALESSSPGRALIYGFDGVLIWDLYEDVPRSKSLGLVYREKVRFNRTAAEK